MTVNNTPNNKSLSGVTGRDASAGEVAQHNGYVRGRNDEYAVQRQARAQERTIAQSQANSSATSGLLAGLLLALLAGGIGAAVYFLAGDHNLPNPIAVPQTEKETVREKETTIIEREVPSPDVSLPDVQIEIPDVSLPDVSLPDVNVGQDSSAGAEDAASQNADAPAEATSTKEDSAKASSDSEAEMPQ
ncbi:MAG: hypothetical protein AB8B99_19710 [Phormidesmis sp.]